MRVLGFHGAEDAAWLHRYRQENSLFNGQHPPEPAAADGFIGINSTFFFPQEILRHPSGLPEVRKCILIVCLVGAGNAWNNRYARRRVRGERCRSRSDGYCWSMMTRPSGASATPCSLG